jgi:superfamily II DNA or RNA helicase
MRTLPDFSFRIYYSPADKPLVNFYIPALSASMRYDRSAGFFSSSALAAAAAGVARLIHNDGRMRLLVGAALHEEDVAAIQRGYDLRQRLSERMLDQFPDPEDALLRHRLEVLAWMVSREMLEIRVVLPCDAQGVPYAAGQTQDYFHAKTGIFTDGDGNQVAFSGSVNESATGWKHNYENFAVYFSWNETKAYLAQVVANFEALWNGKEHDWIAVEIPDAIKQRLLQYTPTNVPTHDLLEPLPLETKEEKPPYLIHNSWGERLIFQFVRDAPYLLNGQGLGAATAALMPWPHQSRVADTIINDFPRRALLCDEVGLGKTIEAGLVLRQLLLSGRVQRVLILAPKSVLKQWQEELYEKFNLDVPRFDGSRFWSVEGRPLEYSSENPWDAFSVFLAGSQLAKRADRRDQILAACGWDLLIVDEAHHARRKDFKERIYRPNRLLGLLNDLDEAGKITGMLLMTATPMQVHPIEVWDLVKALGMGGRWGADEDNYLEFFSEMRKPFHDIDWDFVMELVRDELEAGGTIDEAFERQAAQELGAVKWSLLKDLPTLHGSKMQAIRQIGEQSQAYVKELARRHTPLRRFLFRNTRSLLRQYWQRGILKEKVPTRRPQIIRVPMTVDEYSLYERIDEYISHFYQVYEQERRGLGFIMTVYRRRLTSSFYAVRCSLERRLQYLRGEIHPEQTYDEDDIEQEELSLDISEEALIQTDQKRLTAELAYVQNFIQDLRHLSISDSKLEHLKGELNQVFLSRSKVLVFTQYTDTMDYLRNQLVDVYGSEIACYSGRGGEIWNGIAWVVTTKEQVKNEFKSGDIRILVCSDSASEGLNLQTCGVLINYDMPWNPMRVEQRIGRIDRIGQEFDEVWISNYFYQDTIEDLIYQRLADRIDWFEVVVGDLQPILAEVGETTRRIAMLPAFQREAELEKAIRELRDRLQNRQFESLDLDEYATSEEIQPVQPPPLTLPELEELLIKSSFTRHRFEPHPDIDQAYLLSWRDQILPVTFSPTCFDEHPDTVRFLSFGSTLLEELLADVPQLEDTQAGAILRLATKQDSPITKCGFYVSGEDGQLITIETLAELRTWLETKRELLSLLDENQQETAKQIFLEQIQAEQSRYQSVLRKRHTARMKAEHARAQGLLVKAALVEVALGQNPTMWDNGHYPTTFSETAIKGLQRHGYPWGPLLMLSFDPELSIEESDPFFQKIQNASREVLRGHFSQLSGEAKRLVNLLSILNIEDDNYSESIECEVKIFNPEFDK